MGIRMTVSFKGTDGIRGKNGGKLMGRKISTAGEITAMAKIARARITNPNVGQKIFEPRLTGWIL